MPKSTKSDKIADAIAELERAIAIDLPPEYRRHLMRGVPWKRPDPPLAVRVGSGDRYPDLLEIHALFDFLERQFVSLGRRMKSMTVRWMLDVHRNRPVGEGRIPEDSIAIGYVITDADIIIYIRGPRRGEVWLKSFDRLERDGIDEPNDDLRFLAKDFDAFHASLVPDEIVPD